MKSCPIVARRRNWRGETEAPVKPDTETETDDSPEVAEEEDLGEKVRRIIREIPDPTPQPGGQ